MVHILGVYFAATVVFYGLIRCFFFLLQKSSFKGKLAEPLAFLLVGFLGYLQFWLTWLNPLIGKSVAILVIPFALFGIYKSFHQMRQNKKFFYVALIPTLIASGYGLFVHFVWLMFAREGQPVYLLHRFLELPPDPFLPEMFADMLRKGQALSPFFIDWEASDRPPLQTGLSLLFSPNKSASMYIAIGIVLQASVFASIYQFLKIAGLRAASRMRIIAMVCLLGFSVLNTHFIWPKSLAASFGFLCLSFVLMAAQLERDENALRLHLLGREFRIYRNQILSVFAGVLLGLAMMAHGGVFFSIPMVPLVFLAIVKKERFKRFFEFGCCFSLGVVPFLASWAMFQKFVDPPGNRLIKWHLGGVQDKDTKGTLETLVNFYQNQTLDGWLNDRWKNIWEIFEHSSSYSPLFKNPVQMSHGLRAEEFFSLFRTAHILNFGIAAGLFLVFCYFVWRSSHFMKVRKQMLKWQWILLLSGIVATVFWCVLMAIPASTVIHQGSYLTHFALFIAMAMGFELFGAVPVLFVILFEVYRLCSVWIFSEPFGGQGKHFTGRVEIFHILTVFFGVMFFAWLFHLRLFYRQYESFAVMARKQFKRFGKR